MAVSWTTEVFLVSQQRKRFMKKFGFEEGQFHLKVHFRELFFSKKRKVHSLLSPDFRSKYSVRTNGQLQEKA